MEPILKLRKILKYYEQDCSLKKSKYFLCTKHFLDEETNFLSFIKPSAASQRSAKINISVIFLSSSGIGMGRVKME